MSVVERLEISPLQPTAVNFAVTANPLNELAANESSSGKSQNKAALRRMKTEVLSQPNLRALLNTETQAATNAREVTPPDYAWIGDRNYIDLNGIEAATVVSEVRTTIKDDSYYDNEKKSYIHFSNVSTYTVYLVEISYADGSKARINGQDLSDAKSLLKELVNKLAQKWS